MRFPTYKYVLAFIDWLTITIAFVAALSIHTNKNLEIFISTLPFISPEILVFIGYAAVCLLVFQYNNLYNINVILSVADHLVRLLKTIGYMMIGLAVLSFFTKSSFIITESRFVVLSFAVISLVLLILARLIIFRNGLKLLAHFNFYQRLVIIIGAGKLGRLFAANLSIKNPYGLRILGFLDNLHPVGNPIFRGLKVIGKIEDVKELTSQYAIDEIIVCVEDVTSEQFLEILENCQQTRAQVKIATPLYDIIPTFRFTERYGEIPLVGLSQTSPGALREFYKRLFDTVLAAIGIILLSPLFIVIAIAIKLDSRGPILYLQKRIGKNGRPFIFYKFRSMFIGSDGETHRHKLVQFIRSKEPNGNGSTKVVDESRITSVGRFIRKTSLDELPQLFNVIKGDMSLVGPRPCLPYEWDHYEEWHKKRLDITPGCTGIWQVSGRSSVGFDDMVILDFYYIRNTSLFLDIQLIFKTIPVMVFGKGGK
jgi:exopolysaccharide biosynthesis polyprenyl glycosylphosphotransferase